MKVGFSTLSLFMKPLDEMLEIAARDNFDSIELLSEAVYGPEHLLENKHLLEPFFSYDLDYYIHAPNIDINIASLNKGIRLESIRQIKSCLDLAEEIGAKAITVHPGHIGRIDERVRNLALELSKESVRELMEYKGDFLSIENMPNKPKFLGTKTSELKDLVDETGCGITIDIGHANTCPGTSEFLDIPNIRYFHLSDNDGIKDQHIILGDGVLDLSLLSRVENGILELNTYEKVLKSRETLLGLDLL